MQDDTAHVEPTLVDRPGSVWIEPTPPDEPERKAFFEENGFLILRNLLGREELAELDRELNRLAEERDALTTVREGWDVERAQDPSRGKLAFRKIGGVTHHSQAFARLLRHPRIVDVLHRLLGPTLQLYRDVVMMKAARVGRQKPWHQDAVYWPWRPMGLVSVMTAIDDAKLENGCLQIIAGSHKSVLKHHGPEPQIDADEQTAQRAYAVPLNAGDCLVFHSLLLHGSQPNRSDADRRVAIMAYKTPQMKFVGDGDPPDCPTVLV